MLVTKDNFKATLQAISKFDEVSLDTETTGLHPYHNDRLFSIIIGTPQDVYYFNFNNKHPPYLNCDYFSDLDTFFHENKHIKIIFAHAKFDLAMLENAGILIKNPIFDILTFARLEYNQHAKYSLAFVGMRLGYTKDTSIDKYIAEHKLYTLTPVPGKKKVDKLFHFEKVPIEIIQPYAEQDARITLEIYKKQKNSLAELKDIFGARERNIGSLTDNEMALIRVCQRMEARGISIDHEYVGEGIKYETNKEEKYRAEFEGLTGSPYMASNKLLQAVFATDKSIWQYTKKGNPCFESSVIETFKSPAAIAVVKMRRAKAKLDFFNGFLYHADGFGIVHPNWNQSFTDTGRFSSSQPNFQNLKKEETNEEFPIRRAIVPRKNHILIAPDWDQVEYRLLMEYVCRFAGRRLPLVIKILDGLDVHSAMAIEAYGNAEKNNRDNAKNINFGIIYGQGDKSLAKKLNVSLEEARRIKKKVFDACPEIEKMIIKIIQTAIERKRIYNWSGRIHQFPWRDETYKAPNSLFQGGAADMMKFAMVKTHAFLQDKRSKIIMTIHDELVIEVHESEINIVPKEVKTIMETIFPSEFLPMTVGMKWSAKSLAGMEKGMPHGAGE